MVIKTKSHTNVTYVDTNNFYGLVINAVYESNLESVKSNEKVLLKKNIKQTNVYRLPQTKVK